MFEFFPYFTNDGSVGLYSKQEDDIYHSTYGALTEAYEKFILPANFIEYFKNNDKIKILDICYGIGYNSKCFIDYFIKNFEKNISENNINIETIDTNNKFYEIYIKAVDTNKNLFLLSPFIETDKKIFFNNKINFHHEKISKLLMKNTKKKFNYGKFVNYIVLKKILKIHPDIFENEEINSILNDKKYQKYFDKSTINLYRFYHSQWYPTTLARRINAILHNIYYKYISMSYKKALKYLKLNDFIFEAEFNDARLALKSDKCVYDFIFLDAFTPAKCPCLWTVDFFKLLHAHLNNNGMILTYSNSALVRNAFIQAGFWVGKIYNKDSDKFIGTIACKKLDLIKHGLSEYDLGLINTKAGIVYRDNDLNLNNEAILASHSIEVATSKLQSSSKFIKMFRGVNV